MVALGAAVPTFALYLATLPRAITLEDAGLFALTCATGSIAHPPGYALYSMICPAFAHLPGLEPVVGLNVLSALCGAATIGVLAGLILTLTASRTASVAAALTAACGAALWSQAVIAEVYTLETLLATAATWLCILYSRTANPRLLTPLSLTVGLGLANHWPLFLACGPAFAILLARRWQVLLRQLRSPRHLLGVSTGAAAGLALIAWLSWQLFQPHAFAMLPPAESSADVLAYLSRSMYASVDANPLALPGDPWRFTIWLVPEAMRQYGLVIVALALAGAGILLARREYVVLTATLTLLLCHSVVLAQALGFPFDYHWQGVFRPYPLMAWLVLSIWLGVTLAALCQHLHSRLPPPLLAVLALLVPTWVGWHNYAEANRSSDRYALDFATTILEALPARAVLFTHGDAWTASIGYVHHALGLRPDVVIRDADGLLFANRLYHPAVAPDEERRRINAYLESLDRPAFYAVHLRHDQKQVRHGLHWRLLPASADVDPRCQPPDTHVRFVLRNLDNPPHVPMNRHLHNGLITSLMECALTRVPEPAYLALVTTLQREPAGLFPSLAWLVDRTASPARDAELQALVERGQAMLDQHLPMTVLEQANAFAYIGHAQLELGEPDQARRSFERSLGIADVTSTTARWGLARVYVLLGDDPSLQRLLERYPDDPALAPYRQPHTN